MSNLLSTLKDEIARIARKQAKSLTGDLKRHSAQFRRDIARLKRDNDQLRRRVATLEASDRKRGGRAVIDDVDESVISDGRKIKRFQARGVKTHREKLGLSAADYGRLLGVSGQTVYFWEQGKSKPRRKQFAALLAIRGMGKREALARLEQMNGAKPAAESE